MESGDGKEQIQHPKLSYTLLLFVVLLFSVPVVYFSMVEYTKIRQMLTPSVDDLATAYLMPIINAKSNNDSGLVESELKKNAANQPDLSSETLVRAVLEVKLIDDVSRQIEASLISRTWLRFITILFGGISLIIGAVFILANVKADRSKISANIREEFGFQFAANSPGLFLVLFGVVLIIMSGVSDGKISSRRPSTYISSTIYGNAQEFAESNSQKLIQDSRKEAENVGKSLEKFLK